MKMDGSAGKGNIEEGDGGEGGKIRRAEGGANQALDNKKV